MATLTECIICDKFYDGFGNNPHPIRNNGRCCDDCHRSTVVPARLNYTLTQQSGGAVKERLDEAGVDPESFYGHAFRAWTGEREPPKPTATVIVNPMYAGPPKKMEGGEAVPSVRYVEPDDTCSFCLEDAIDGKTYYKLHGCNHFYCRRCKNDERLTVCGSCNRGVTRSQFERAMPFRALVKGQVIELEGVVVKEEEMEDDN